MPFYEYVCSNCAPRRKSAEDFRPAGDHLSKCNTRGVDQADFRAGSASRAAAVQTDFKSGDKRNLVGASTSPLGRCAKRAARRAARSGQAVESKPAPGKVG